MMKREVLLLSGFAFLFGCQDSSGPDAPYLQSDPLTHEGYCTDFVDENPGTWNVKIGLDVDIPKSSVTGKTLDYFILKIYGHDPRIMDAPACEYFRKKIAVGAEQFDENMGVTIPIQILASLSLKNANYFSFEGYQIMPDDSETRVLSRNASPMSVSLNPKHYEIDSLVWVE